MTSDVSIEHSRNLPLKSAKLSKAYSILRHNANFSRTSLPWLTIHWTWVSSWLFPDRLHHLVVVMSSSAVFGSCKCGRRGTAWANVSHLSTILQPFLNKQHLFNQNGLHPNQEESQLLSINTDCPAMQHNHFLTYCSYICTQILCSSLGGVTHPPLSAPFPQWHQKHRTIRTKLKHRMHKIKNTDLV